MKSADIFAAGYAVPLYDIRHNTRLWRYRDEEYTLPSGAVPLCDLPGLGFHVAKIEDVRSAHEG